MGGVSSTNSAGQGANPAGAAPAANATQDAATRAVEASRQAGVVNTAELSKDVAAAYEQDPQQGAALHAAVNERLSPQDQAALDWHLAPTLAGVALARTADRTANTPQGLSDRQFSQTADTVHAKATEMGLGGDIVVQGSRANGTAKPTSDLDLGIRVSPEKFDDFLNTQSRLKSPNPGSNLAETRVNAEANGIIQRGEARLSTTGKALERNLGMEVDLSVVREGGRFDTRPTLDVPTARAATVRAAGQGALVGVVIDGGLATVSALRDGQISGAEAGAMVEATARGATVGATYAVTERGLVHAADRLAGPALQNTLGTGARVVGTRLAGAGAAGAVISAGVSVVENFDGLKQGDSQAIGRVAGDVVVGAGSALAGAAAGAAVGSVVPVVGTAVGAVVGLGVGVAADYIARAGGVDKAVANAVSSGVDLAKSAASRVAGWLGW